MVIIWLYFLFYVLYCWCIVINQYLHVMIAFTLLCDKLNILLGLICNSFGKSCVIWTPKFWHCIPLLYLYLYHLPTLQSHTLSWISKIHRYIQKIQRDSEWCPVFYVQICNTFYILLKTHCTYGLLVLGSKKEDTFSIGVKTLTLLELMSLAMDLMLADWGKMD